MGLVICDGVSNIKMLLEKMAWHSDWFSLWVAFGQTEEDVRRSQMQTLE